jgi:hypothetical protein
MDGDEAKEGSVDIVGEIVHAGDAAREGVMGRGAVGDDIRGDPAVGVPGESGVKVCASGEGDEGLELCALGIRVEGDEAVLTFARAR